jgi:mannose/fructose/N-acetylgalactosamine-specific phosphotransferase system component IIC
MIPVQTVLTIYFMFALMCLMPWAINWASHGALPVTARLVALFVFFCTLFTGGDVLWTIHDEMPSRTMDALSLLFPMLLFSAFGIVIVMKSLVEMVKKYKEEDDESQD